MRGQVDIFGAVQPEPDPEPSKPVDAVALRLFEPQLEGQLDLESATAPEGAAAAQLP